MVAQAVHSNAWRGLRALDPMRDIYGVARLLEEAFRPEHNFPLSQIPLLREMGIWMWTLSYAPAFPPNLSGFVWIENKRIVGNITVTQDERRPELFMISNVAVKPEFRQQGIARELMIAALADVHQRQAKTVFLNVRPDNASAAHLYTSLGFYDLELRGEWRLRRGSLSPVWEHGEGVKEEWGEVRSLRSSDHQAVVELLRAVVPTRIEPLRAVLNEFSLPFDEQLLEWLTDRVSGQRSQRWALVRGEKLAAVMLARGQRFLSPHRIAVQVHPRFRGQVENELLALALAYLQKFPAADIRATAADSHPEWITALEQQGFVFTNGLRLMAYTFV